MWLFYFKKTRSWLPFYGNCLVKITSADLGNITMLLSAKPSDDPTRIKSIQCKDMRKD